MSAKPRFGERRLGTLLILTLVVSDSGRPVAAEQIRASGTGRRHPSSELASWWTLHQQYDPSHRPHAWPSPSARVDPTLPGSVAQAWRHSSRPGVSSLQAGASAIPTASTGAVQQTVAAIRDSAAFAGASQASGIGGSGLDRSATYEGQVSVPSAELSAPSQPLARAWWRGQGHDRRADSLQDRGDGSRRSLAALVASDVPRAALEDVLLTDDELAHTQSGADHDSLEARSCDPLVHPPPAQSGHLLMRYAPGLRSA